MMEWVFLVGSLVLVWLMYRRWREYQTIKDLGCSSCRSLNVQDRVLTAEECKRVLDGDRVPLKKLGKRVTVKRLREAEEVRDAVFLNDTFSGGEVRGEGQIVYGIVGRRVTGKGRHMPVSWGEKWVAIVHA